METKTGSSIEFFQSLDMAGGAATAERILRRFPLAAATIGLDGLPQVRPVELAFERDGALYFLTRKCLRFYGELSQTPFIQIMAFDPETKTEVRVSGKAVFTEDEEVLERGVNALPHALDEAGGEMKMLIAFFLTGMRAELASPCAGIASAELELPEPDGVLIGITIKKKPELRDRIVRVLERREEEPPEQEPELLKLYDGALFVFAEAAKAIWPRMNVQPIERAACFETWDEREKYTRLAARLIGNAVIDSPEDVTYWLNPETLKGLKER